MSTENNQNKLPTDQREVFLIEYQAAQDSAQHHDNLVWTITSLNWVGSAVLMGFVLGKMENANRLSEKCPLLFISIVGIILTGCVWRWAYQMRCVKVAKYQRCKVIENILGMEQHSKLVYKAGSQTKTYALSMASFLVAWFVLCVFIIIA